MKTNTFKRSMAITIALASVLAIGFFALPVSVSAATVSTPQDTIISVQQGQTFLVRTTITLNNAAQPGYFAIALHWDAPFRWDNYTLENTPFAYWTSGGSGVGNPVENVQTDNNILYPAGAGLYQASVWIDSADKNYYDGTFNVDIWLRAASFGAPHQVGLENNLSYGAGVVVTEPSPVVFSQDNVAVDTTSWNSGIVVNGGASAYNVNTGTSPPPFDNYIAGSYPPAAAAQRVGSGAVFASGWITATIYDRWKNPAGGAPNMDKILDTVMQWEVPGADNIYWYAGHNTSIGQAFKSDNLIKSWQAMGYTVDNDNGLYPEMTAAQLTGRDILILAGCRSDGPTNQGGNPDNWTASEISAITTFVSGGGGLILLDGADYSSNGQYCYNRVSNKILKALGFNWALQNDSINDNLPPENFAPFYYYIYGQPSTAIGAAYAANVGTDNINSYSIPSLTVWPTLVVDVGIVPLTQNGAPLAVLTYNVTITNNGDTPDNFKLVLTEDNAWGAILSALSTGFILPAGTSTPTISVTLPAAASGSEDHITVTAYSFWDNSGTGTDAQTCTARIFFGYDVDENVAPASQTVPILSSATVQDNVYNTGANLDNLIVNIYDSLGWIAPINTIDLNVLGGGMVIHNITVPVPPPTGVTDTITMVVTSQNDNTKTVTKTVTVTSGPSAELALVWSTITGDTVAHATSVGTTLINPAYTYDPLTLTVAVYNLGQLDDKYLLTVWDDSGTLGLKLTPDEVFVPSGDVVYVALSVTLPSSWVGGQQSIIHVLENGQLSSQNEQHIYPTYLENIQVTAGTVTGVAKNIMPDTLEPQTGAPGSPLVWLIALKNTGNVPEDLSLEILSEDVTGVSTPPGSRTGWDNTGLDNTTWSVGVGQTVITYLRTWVPADAKTSEWDNITIMASDNFGDTDIEWVRAHVVQPGPRIPEGVIEIAVEAQIVAIETWPATYDFGVMDQAKTANTSDNIPGDNSYFTIRNSGNVPENILVRGSDAKSMPGEPVATWVLDSVPGVNHYVLTMNLKPSGTVGLTTVNQQVTAWNDMLPGTERNFGLTIQTPTAITTPARMWARIYITAIAP